MHRTLGPRWGCLSSQEYPQQGEEAARLRDEEGAPAAAAAAVAGGGDDGDDGESEMASRDMEPAELAAGMYRTP